MRHNILFSLKLKVFAALLAFFAVAAVLLAYMVLAMQEMQRNQRLLDDLAQLQTRSADFFRRSKRYVTIAPRSFPAYNRDVIVFFPDFLADLKGMDRLTREIREAYLAPEMGGLVMFGLGLRSATLDQSVNRMTSQWQRFSNGLRAQLGDNDKEPRLEWGAEYIKANQGALHSAVDAVVTGLRSGLDQQGRQMRDASYTGIAVLAVFMVLGTLWFYFGVTRRISGAVRGCVRVASGDFGYQMTTRGRDEIGVLGTAINNLSARARFVLTLQQRLRQTHTRGQALQALWGEGNALLCFTWIGLYQQKDGRMKLDQALPEGSPSVLKRQDLRHQHAMAPVLASGEPVVVADITESIADDPTARLARDAQLTHKDTESLLVLPLQNRPEPEQILVLCSQRPDAFGEEQQALLRNMLPVLARAMNPKQESTPPVRAANSEFQPVAS